MTRLVQTACAAALIALFYATGLHRAVSEWLDPRLAAMAVAHKTLVQDLAADHRLVFAGYRSEAITEGGSLCAEIKANNPDDQSRGALWAIVAPPYETALFEPADSGVWAEHCVSGTIGEPLSLPKLRRAAQRTIAYSVVALAVVTLAAIWWPRRSSDSTART